jgi:hypothetical protein
VRLAGADTGNQLRLIEGKTDAGYLRLVAALFARSVSNPFDRLMSRGGVEGGPLQASPFHNLEHFS